MVAREDSKSLCCITSPFHSSMKTMKGSFEKKNCKESNIINKSILTFGITSIFQSLPTTMWWQGEFLFSWQRHYLRASNHSHILLSLFFYLNLSKPIYNRVRSKLVKPIVFVSVPELWYIRTYSTTITVAVLYCKQQSHTQSSWQELTRLYHYYNALLLIVRI